MRALTRCLLIITRRFFYPQDLTIRKTIPLYFPEGVKQNEIFHDPGINKIENRRVGTLSMGQQRYFQFLLVLHLHHPFLLLDEPFSMIEPLYKEFIIAHIAHHRQRKGFIVTDHYYRDVLKVASMKRLIKDGSMMMVNDEKDLVDLGYLSRVQDLPKNHF
jgi:ABC-type lipopolysaccharide export system ATPase subunit